MLKDLIKTLGNEDADTADSNDLYSDVCEFYDTGSYTMNAALSGSLFGGLPSNKITALAAESATGKTYYALQCAKAFQNRDSKAVVFYFDSEGAVDKDTLKHHDIDTSRFVMVPVITIQEFRTQAVKVVDKYLETKKKDRIPVMFILDSLGNLSTSKEVEDTAKGSDTRDMTRAQLVRGAFRVLTLKTAKANIPVVVVNHVYQVVGCLTEGYQVRMADGTLVPIEAITQGDVVQTLGENKMVTDLYRYDDQEVYEMELEDGNIIRATANHKFMTNQGEWKRIDSLESGDSLILV